jgi:CheY-like chemotaxis protein
LSQPELSPTLVVTDHHLPDQRGQDLIAHLRACPKGCRLPVVMVSGDALCPTDLGEIVWFGKPDTWAGWRDLAQQLLRRIPG